jgi:hypothetical protein
MIDFALTEWKAARVCKDEAEKELATKEYEQKDQALNDWSDVSSNRHLHEQDGENHSLGVALTFP